MSLTYLPLALRCAYGRALLALRDATTAYETADHALHNAQNAAYSSVDALRDVAKGNPVLEAQTFALWRAVRDLEEGAW